ETRRRRGKGYDWIIINLGVPGMPKEFEINTHFFKGNYPDSFSIQANMENKTQSIKSIVNKSQRWKTIIKKTKLKANSSLKIKNNYLKNVNYIKINIFPDGGISRFRARGKVK
ncbi:MAG: allantoicase, partial [Rickettsiales bacterium]|nr:allantoicase [Rickettsiales bacterium]